MKIKKWVIIILTVLFVATAYTSCKSASKMGCPAYGDTQRYYKEKW